MVNRVQQADCVFNLARVDRHLEARARTVISKGKTRVMKVDERAKAYLGGVLEHVTSKIVQEAVAAAERSGKASVLPKSVMIGMRGHDELSILASGSAAFVGSYLDPKKVDGYVNPPIGKKKKK